MYTMNLKKRLSISLILAAMLLSGCQKKTESSQGESSDVSSSAPAESSVASSTKPTESSSVPAESSTVSSAKPEESSSVPTGSSVVSSVQPAESIGFSLPEEPPYGEPPELFPADRVYPDDKLVPSDWLRVASYAEGMAKINDILNSDASGKDLESALAVLMDRNMLVHGFFFGRMELFEFDWNSPYDSPDFEKPIYPMTSEYFYDVQSISDLVYGTYEHSAAEKILHGWKSEPLLTEVNGQMYINVAKFPNLSNPSFTAGSYVEITEKSENKCAFIWHFPDLEELNAPESGYEFHYFKKKYTAEYIDGAWKLTDIVFDNGFGIF